MIYDLKIAPWIESTGSYVNQYKAGKITDDEFFDGIRYRIGKDESQMPNDVIKKCWNKMCEIPSNALESILETFELLEKNDKYQIIFINSTNEMHFQFNMEQLEEIVGKDQLHGQNVHFVNSHEFNILEKNKLAQQGILKLQKEGEIVPNSAIEAVISFDNGIKSSSILTECEGDYIEYCCDNGDNIKNDEGNCSKFSDLHDLNFDVMCVYGEDSGQYSDLSI